MEQSASRMLLLLLPTVAMVLAAHMITVTDAAFTAKRVIHIKNDIAGGLKLKVHCKSKDDDLGEHELSAHQSYVFSFRDAIFFMETLFFCRFSWDGGKESHWFDIYKQGDYDCKDCYWSILNPGPCFTDPGAQPQCFQWNS